MHKLILGKRNHSAHTRILKAAHALSEKFEIPADAVAALKVQEKDAEVRAMKEREAVASLLEAVATSLGIDLAPEPEAQESAPEAGDAGDGEGVARKTGEEFITVPAEGEGVTQETDGASDPEEAASQGDAGEGLPAPDVSDSAAG